MISFHFYRKLYKIKKLITHVHTHIHTAFLKNQLLNRKKQNSGYVSRQISSSIESWLQIWRNKYKIDSQDLSIKSYHVSRLISAEFFSRNASINTDIKSTSNGRLGAVDRCHDGSMVVCRSSRQSDISLLDMAVYLRAFRQSPVIIKSQSCLENVG